MSFPFIVWIVIFSEAVQSRSSTILNPNLTHINSYGFNLKKSLSEESDDQYESRLGRQDILNLFFCMKDQCI